MNNNSHKIITNNYNFNPIFDNLKITPIVDKKDDKMANSAASNMVSNHLDSVNSIVNHELIPYPPNCISTIIEKANDDAPHQVYGQSRPALAHRRRRKKKPLYKQESDVSHSSQENPSETNTENASLYDGQNKAIICFDTHDISQIVKRLSERIDISTQTEPNEKCNQYVQVNCEIGITDSNSNTVRQSEIQRSNQALRNQIQQLSYIIEEMSKERSSHNVYVHQLQKEISQKELKIKEFENRNEKYLRENNELKSMVDKLRLNDYEGKILAFKAENELLRQKLNQPPNHPVGLEKVDLMNQKDSGVQDLNKLVQHSHQMENIHLNNNNDNDDDEDEKLNHHIKMLENDSSLVAIRNNQQEREEEEKGELKFVANKKCTTTETTIETQRWQKIRLLLDNMNAIIKEKCFHFRQQLDSLKMEFQNNMNNMMNYYPEKLLDIQRLYSMKTVQYCEQFKSEMARMKDINEQLLREKLLDNDRNVQLNCEYQSCLDHLKMENEHLKQMNQTLETDVQNLRNDLEKLQLEHQNSLGQIDDFHSTVGALQSQLSNADEYQSSNRMLKQEINHIQELLAKSEQKSLALASEHERLSQANAKNQTDLERLTREINDRDNQISLDFQEKQNYRQEIQSLNDKIFIQTEEIKELEENMKKLRENFEKSKITPSPAKDGELKLEGKTMPQGENHKTFDVQQDGVEDLKKLIEEKNLSLNEQHQKLIHLGIEIEDLSKEKIQFENNLNLATQMIQEKESIIKQLNETIFYNQPQQQQRISNLESELSKEKERSKGLSLALMKEKRINSKLETDLNQLKESTDERQSNTTINGDISQQKQELVSRIRELQQLVAQSENAPFPVGTIEMDADSERLIKLLEQTDNDREHLSNPKPLNNVHSKVEDLRKEFDKFKMTFLQEFQMI